MIKFGFHTGCNRLLHIVMHCNSPPLSTPSTAAAAIGPRGGSGGPGAAGIGAPPAECSASALPGSCDLCCCSSRSMAEAACEAD